MSNGLDNVPIRFFVWNDDYDEDGEEIMECDEGDFLACHYPITYERHTVFSNGVSQICLTKMPKF